MPTFALRRPHGGGYSAAMLDIHLIREKPDFVRERLATRGGGDEGKINEVLRADGERRKLETALQHLNAERRRLSKEIGAKRAASGATADFEARVREIGDEIVDLNKRTSAAEEEQRNLLLEIANLPHESVPIGKDPSANRVVRSWGEKPRLTDPADHVALGAKLKLFDLERAAKLSGSGFICFTDAGARLERALINFMIELHVREHGYIEISPPFLVRRDCMIGTSQLPKFEADMYGLEENQLFLTPTAEVPLTNLYRDEILNIVDLPKKFVAYTPCFRREAGAAGRETRGIIRVHQFDKVELVKITTSCWVCIIASLSSAPAIWVSGQPRLTTSKCGRQARTHISKFRVARILGTSKPAGCTFDIKTLKGKIGFATR